jgi:hypothetical protein
MSEAPRCPHCGTSLPATGGSAALGTHRNGHAPDPGNGHLPAPGNGHAAGSGNGHGAGAVSGGPMATERALDSLYQEVRRIREIAESRPAEAPPARAVAGPAGARPWNASRAAEARPAPGESAAPGVARAAGDDRRRIEELTREVQELRITVARLRGMAVPGAIRSA